MVYALALTIGCVWPAKYEREEVTLERIASRDAWLQTFVPFALAFLLVLLLVVSYYRRNAPDALDGLFKPRRGPDIVGAVRAWWRRQQELEPFRWLHDLDEYRARTARRAAWREADRIARLEADRAEREALRRAEEARRALPPLGPSRLGFFSRFAIGFLAGVGVTVILILPFFGPDPSGFAGYAIFFGGGGGIIIAFIASLVCAILVSAVEEKRIWLSMICGVAGAAVGGLLLPWLFTFATPVLVLGGGAGIGLAIGVADKSSRKPESVSANQSSA